LGKTPAHKSNPSLAEALEATANATAEETVDWAAHRFPSGGLVMTSSFGVQAAVMLHLVTRRIPDIAVIWIDTGFNFPETYQFADQLTRRFSLNVKIYQSLMSPAHMVALHGPLWEQGVEGMETYNRLRKVEPRDRAFAELGVTTWMSGLRRDQTGYRGTLRKTEPFGKILKLHPILDWSPREVRDYLKAHDLPLHPLVEKGYPSIGDWHSTVSGTGDLDDRSGRFLGLKQECGLHIPATDAENQSRDASGL